MRRTCVSAGGTSPSRHSELRRLSTAGSCSAAIAASVSSMRRSRSAILDSRTLLAFAATEIWCRIQTVPRPTDALQKIATSV
jgi:hypothetical protein